MPCNTRRVHPRIGEGYRGIGEIADDEREEVVLIDPGGCGLYRYDTSIMNYASFMNDREFVLP